MNKGFLQEEVFFEGGHKREFILAHSSQSDESPGANPSLAQTGLRKRRTRVECLHMA
jgi:hypothetical protein